ncbi:MAG: GGDEF domain-containing protein [Burkholderiaceae bacterium]
MTATRDNALRAALTAAALVAFASMLGIEKFPPAALAAAALLMVSGLLLHAFLQARELPIHGIDPRALARADRGAAGWFLLAFGFIGAVIAAGPMVSSDRQIALIVLGVIAPLAMLHSLSRSPLVFVATALPVVLGSIVATLRLGAALSPWLVLGLVVALAVVLEQAVRTMRTTDQHQRARSRERSLLSQQLALFSTSQLGIAQTTGVRIGRANARFRQWFGEGSGDALITDMAASIGMSRDRLQRLIKRADERVGGHDSRTVSILLNGATPRYFSVQVRRFDPANQNRGLLWTVSDQTSDWLRQQANERAATRDPLTGALNRRALHKRISSMLARDLRRQPFAVLCVDINRFGDLNQANGEGFGDQILCIVARRLQRTLREQDLIARTGGNEFVLVLENVNGMERASQIAEKVMETLSAPIVLTSMTCTIAASVGVAVAPLHGRRTDEILGRARSSMFAIKRTLVQVQAGKMGRRP